MLTISYKSIIHHILVGKHLLKRFTALQCDQLIIILKRIKSFRIIF